MTTTAVALQKFFAAEAAYLTEGGSFDGMATFLAPDVVMYQAENLPYGGEWHGPQGMAEFMAAMGSAWQALEFIEQRFVTEGDTTTVYSRGRLQARATGRVLDTAVMQLIIVRDGLVTEIRPFYLDTAAVLEALG